MALIKCNDCGKEISEFSKTCPNCGCPNVTYLKEKWTKYDSYRILCIAFFFIFLLIFFIRFIISEHDDSLATKILPLPIISWSTIILLILSITYGKKASSISSKITDIIESSPKVDNVENVDNATDNVEKEENKIKAGEPHIICPKCTYLNGATSKYCYHCGASLKE